MPLCLFLVPKPAKLPLDGVYYALMVRALKWSGPVVGVRHTRLPEGLTPRAFDRRSRFHQTLPGWMAAPHPARLDVGSAAAVLWKAQDFLRIGGSENPA